MAASGSSSARSSLFIQLSPSRSAKLSFTIQLMLTLLWVVWAAMLAFSDTTSSGESYLFYAFLALAIAFLVYVILQNTSIFGFQSYIEVTPEYIVRKHGVFRPKFVVAIPDIKAVYISPLALRVTENNDNQTYFDLKQVRKRRDKEKIKNKVRDLAMQHGFEVTEASSNQ
ncbi:hypothetical protein H8S95_07275 [Pontibacter sp. KCTC 32443]|uniref:hypothetical protein n=1 Tax=Pontibacter TaxID=323449 RepID=UPI00164DBF4D|nr:MULTISPECIES: hypothetical protein [Pontibacter]MBC5773859.1 hypothetical protein [Pontibacter sp. KCTC 32443]